jgi:3-oxoacyl-[acyl-carrier protein] reductase
MDLQLTGKRALVTGSSAGIGRAIASRLAGEGVVVVVTGRDGQKAAAVAKDIQGETGQLVVSVSANLATDDGAMALAGQVTAHLGSIDILVNNHGIYHERGWWDTGPNEWADIYNRMSCHSCG